MLEPQLYDQASLAELPWPATPDGQYAREFLGPFIAQGPSLYIQNAQTELLALRLEELVLPVTVTDHRPGNSYVCSPYSQYFAYSRQELHKLNNPPLERLFRALLGPLDSYFQPADFDRTVYVNNWLLSTNLYPALTVAQIERMSAFLIDRFPQRPVVFRSVDHFGNPMLFDTLRRLGYRSLFSRQIFYQDPRDPALLRKKQQKIDLKHYRRSAYHLLNHADLTPVDYPRLLALYGSLYLEKYSYLNPQFSEAFVALAHQKKLLTFKAFALDGRIDAVLGYFQRGGKMTAPFFGYDRSLPQRLGLYRLLSTQVVLEGQAQGLLINVSAGVGQFKKVRGAVPVMEYNMVYDRHLPPARRRRWALLQLVLDRLAGPIIQKYEL